MPPLRVELHGVGRERRRRACTVASSPRRREPAGSASVHDYTVVRPGMRRTLAPSRRRQRGRARRSGRARRPSCAMRLAPANFAPSADADRQRSGVAELEREARLAPDADADRVAPGPAAEGVAGVPAAACGSSECPRTCASVAGSSGPGGRARGRGPGSARRGCAGGRRSARGRRRTARVREARIVLDAGTRTETPRAVRERAAGAAEDEAVGAARAGGDLEREAPAAVGDRGARPALARAPRWRTRRRSRRSSGPRATARRRASGGRAASRVRPKGILTRPERTLRKRRPNFALVAVRRVGVALRDVARRVADRHAHVDPRGAAAVEPSRASRPFATLAASVRYGSVELVAGPRAARSRRRTRRRVTREHDRACRVRVRARRSAACRRPGSVRCANASLPAASWATTRRGVRPVRHAAARRSLRLPDARHGAGRW